MEGMEWDRSSCLDALFIKIDFEKSYDSIKWCFFLAMLKALGFGPYFIHTLETFFVDAYSCLSINHGKSIFVLLLHSIR